MFRFDRSGWRPGPAAVRFLGVALAVLTPTLLGQHGAGVLAGLGALYAGMASFGGVHPARLRRMLATTLVTAAITLLGCLVGGSDVATIAGVSLGAFVFSLFSVLSPGSSLVVLQATGVLIVLSGLPGVGAHPLVTSLAVLGGGLLQTGLIAAVAPVAPTAAERRAVADAYGSLAHWVDQLAEPDPPAIPAPGPFQEARLHLDEAERFGARKEHLLLRHALEVAERIRSTLVGWGRVATDRPPVADALRLIEAHLRKGALVRPSLRLASEGDPELARWNALLQGAFEALDSPPDAPLPAKTPSGWWPALPARPDSETLRALVFGHALRYTLALGLATAAYRLTDLEHGYWIPLTVAFVLRPDYATTLTRGLARVVGTLVGVAAATAIVAVLHPAPILLTAAMLLAIWIAFAIQRANFVWFTAVLTVYIVFSIAAAGVFDPVLGEMRLVATALGVGVALLTSMLWPNWEARKVQDVLRDAEEAQKDYAEAIETNAPPEEVETAHLKARQLGIEAQRIVDAAGLEPRWGRANHLDDAPERLERLFENAAMLLAQEASNQRYREAV
jgi:uncharacterized membrane protein YccC